MSRRLVGLIVLVIVAAVPCSASEPCPPDASESAGIVRIGALYRDRTIAGTRHLAGIKGAVGDRQADAGLPPLCLQKLPYATEDGGFRLLKETVTAKEIDIVLGPTDSGVFRDAHRNREIFDSAKVPVISSLVTARIELESDGWLFRTNADVFSRTSKILTFLSQEGIKSVGIIYEGSEFGLRAEEAFRNELNPRAEASDGSELYQAIRYTSQADLPHAIEQLKRTRPGAIGIFSSRLGVSRFWEAFTQKNHGFNPYSPLIFTIIDARLLGLEDLYFVSLGSTTPDEDEVFGLAYDTTILVLDVIGRTPGVPASGSQWADSFREGFAGVLEGATTQGPRTGMVFERGQNQASPKVFTFDNKDLIEVPLSAGPSLVRKMTRGPVTLWRRFGIMPFLNLAVLVGLVVWLSRRDLLKWNQERVLGKETKRAVRRVVAFNTGMALVIFFLMILTGAIGWSDPWGAIVVGFGYPALLKSTFGQTKMGRTIGLSELYEDGLRRLHDKLMEAKYREKKAIIDFIALTNPISKLRDTLVSLYDWNQPLRKGELIRQLDEDLERATGLLEKRMVYARRIDASHSWSDLANAGLVPAGISEDELIGPGEILEVAVNYCSEEASITVDKLQKDVEKNIEQLSKRNESGAEAVKNELQDWLTYVTTERGEIRCYLRCLFLHAGFRIDKIVEMGYLPKVARKWSKSDWLVQSRKAPGQAAVAEETAARKRLEAKTLGSEDTSPKTSEEPAAN